MSEALAIPAALRGLRRDCWRILLAGLLLGAAGGVAGAMTARASSQAALLRTVLPLRDAMDKDSFGRMVAEPLRMKTLALLCNSDGTLEKTRALLGDDARPTLEDLRRRLQANITIAEETPSETLYSPIILLTATADDPERARSLVNAWAAACVEESARLRETLQEPAVAAFSRVREQAFQHLSEAMANDNERAPLDVAVAEESYHALALRHEFAQAAYSLDHPDLVLFSEGGRVAPDRLARAVSYALAAALAGLLLGCVASLFFRLIPTTP